VTTKAKEPGSLVTTTGVEVQSPHAKARQWALEGTRQALGREPTLAETQFVQAVAFIESGYGSGWKGEGVGSWNMGAVQTRETDPAKSFLYTDTHPQPDGTSKSYSVRFRKYPGPVEGMADVAKILYRQMKIEPTSIGAVSRQMYDRHYYEGFGPTKEARIGNHVKALTSALSKITAALGESMPSGGSSPTASPKAASAEPQSLLHFLEALHWAYSQGGSIGHSDSGTGAVVAYQASHGLYPDGDIGRKTLARMIEQLKAKDVST